MSALAQSMETFETDGYRARVHRQGSGAPLLYLHSGFGEVGPLPIFAELEAVGFSVVAPEIAGFGRSDPIPEWHRIEDAVFHLRRVLDTLGVARPVVMGSSLGGWLAVELAAWFPERVGALVLVDAVGLRIEGAPIFELFGSELHVTMARISPHGGDVLAALMPAIEGDDDPQAILLHLFHAMEATARIGWNPYFHDPKLAGRLGLITAPTLVVWGADDGVVPLAHGEAYASAIPGAQMEVLEGCGHLPVLEEPAQVARVVGQFAQRQATL